MSPRGPILLKALFTGTLPQDGLAGDEDAKGEQQIATSWLFFISCSAATMNRFWYHMCGKDSFLQQAGFLTFRLNPR